MTAALWLGAMAGLAAQALTSESLYARAALSEDAFRAQMERIRQDLDALGEEYGFDADRLYSLVREEEVRALDQEVIRWWTDFTRTGAAGTEPEFVLAGAEEALRNDAAFLAAQEDPALVKSRIEMIARKAGDGIAGSALLIRGWMVRLVSQMAGQRMNLKTMLAVLRRAPYLAGAFALLMAGVTALLRSRRIQTAGEFIGGAMMAAGVLCAATMGLIRALDLRGMIAEASAGLGTQAAHMARILSLEAAGVSLVLIAAGILLVRRAGKEL